MIKLTLSKNMVEIPIIHNTNEKIYVSELTQASQNKIAKTIRHELIEEGLNHNRIEEGVQLALDSKISDLDEYSHLINFRSLE